MKDSSGWVVFRAWLAVCAAAAMLGGGALEAASPNLSYILPPGVQRGHEHVLTFTGAHFKDAEEVLLYEPGVTVKKVEVVDPQNVKATVEVAPDCRLGQHMAQVRTRSGISDYRSFFVGALPGVDEKEPNNGFDAPQAIDMNVCVTGTLQNEDADYYRVHVAKGQRISVEVEGIRLGQAYFDPFISVMNKNRFELAAVDDTALARQDGFFSVVAPEDGDYTILVRESSYRGADNCKYRLHVGGYPRPSVAYPAGGKRGEQLKVQFLGDAAGPIEKQITLAADAKSDADQFIEDGGGITPSAVPFRAFSEGNVMEAEPNDGFENATVGELPLALNGRLEKAGDVDFFKVSAKKGQTWEVEVYGRRIGSPIDPVLNIYKSDKAGIAGADDARGQDSYLRWQVPEDGDYYLRIADHLNQGGPTYVYRVELTPVTPKLTVGIPRVDRYSQTRQTVVVPRGNRYGTLILATRADFGGPIELLSKNLIPGVTMVAKPMHPSLTLVPAVFEAAEDAPVDGDLIDFRAKLADDKQAPLEGGFENQADFVLGEPNNAVFISGVVNKLAISVAEKVPYHLEIVQPKAPLVRAGTMNLKVLLKRDAGFDGPLTVQFPFNPPGVSSAGAITIDKGQSEGVYPITATADAMLGKWPMMVIGAAEMDGQAWVSSQLAELEIAERFVTFDAKRAACDKGQATALQCIITHNTPFEGKAKAELLGLPPGTTADPIDFDKDTKELAFQVKTTKDTPVGSHKSLICQVTLTQNGDPVIGTVGGTELQVTEPPAAAPAPPAAAAAPQATPAAPAAKPLSRLEQLRAKAREEAKKP
ncbi:MAG: PPC domain-containing protein [Pirellulales bacterium]